VSFSDHREFGRDLIERLFGAGLNGITDEVSQSDDLNDVNSRQFDPAEMGTEALATERQSARQTIRMQGLNICA
jgi:hypothetical protein